MLFNSIEFLLFFPIVLVLYFFIPQRIKWLFLLLVSYYFYMCWSPKYIVLILFSTVVDYLAGIMMARVAEKKKRIKYLLLSLFANLGLLFTFKYFNFFSESITSFFNQFDIFISLPAFDYLLPVGISFYTFQTLSYTIDVYRGKIGAEKHFGKFALYVSFFPQLVAGPIERAKNLLPQFHTVKKYDYKRVTNGLKLVLWGLFKKVVIADRLAVFVEMVFDSPHDYYGLSVIIATIFFAFQIYCDFSGYSDMAIGIAQMLGYDLMDNFRRPYHSKSIGEFWKRWHISLSSWFKDYVYIPLGGNRVKLYRWYLNLFIVFLVSGLWHGANWTFVFWGSLHGLYLIIGIITFKYRQKIVTKIRLNLYPTLHKVIQIFITFGLVCLSWLFFRSDSIGDAFLLIKNIFKGWSDLFILENVNQLIFLGQGFRRFVIAIALILFLELVHFIQRQGSMRQMLVEKPVYVRLIIYSILILSIVVLGQFQNTEFIYFQF
ncbi:MBOAT family protein [Candidatus Falkowbacteria bacterium]|jgi:alginate O-acetyltransferase complex protein AlgI|nr:MBOAT family protein [Candidatus Falkowbacteria bacterium]MBT7007110.1 MBOAT family protein [Candidatus Falkowbacteria bacterium]